VQTIGFLSHLRSKSVLGPYLIIGPLSTLPNWVAEFQRWCPSFPVCLYHGNRQERAAMRAERFRPSSGSTVDDQFPAIVTSYEIVMADRKFLARYTFKYIVVDEGHRLKNFDCKLLRELKTIPSANKLLLSGTPLQNSLPELWSLLHFLLPDVFSSLEQFQSWFDFSGIVSSAPDGAGDEHAKRIADEEHRNKVVSKLHAILRPFLLRRLKSDVEHNLPRKKEILLWAEMAAPQVEFNTALVNRTCDELLRKIASDGGAQSSGVSLNNVLMQLRKNCNHPDLITGGLDGSIHFPSADELVAACGKMRLLDRLLTRLRAKGHKVLIFSQMTRMLDLIAHYCDERGLHCCRIDGSVHWQERRDQIANFNDLTNDAFVFLLSTRAGGLGLNLTAADTVIIYDSDWNPHQDMQAMDRVHRIGQTKPVHVYRLATAHSVEGKMLKRAGSKLMLERLVITHGNFATESVGGGAAGGSAGAGPASKGGAGLSAQELIQLLRGEAAGDDSLPQSGVISDDDLKAVMDRSDLEGVTPKGKAPLPSRGVGFEVVEDKSGKGLLSTVE
jgi:ATP-dependent DNA helicase